MTKKPGILVINLGTPDEPNKKAVRRYLREFLSDPRVLDIPKILRWILLYLIILPFRPKKSAAAYAEIWDKDLGSPLLYHSHQFCLKLQKQLEGSAHVVLGMRYGRPSIESALKTLLAAGCEKIKVLPMFPQYSSAAWGSAVEKVMEVAAKEWNVPSIDVIPPFYNHPAFIDALAASFVESVGDKQVDKILFSYHGLPVRHCQKSDPTGGEYCSANPDCCAVATPFNLQCYRFHSFETSRLLADKLGLPADKWEIAFQSRLGRTPWIQPYSDEKITALAKAGVKHLAVMCPSFVADCLETIEEIGMRAKEDFIASGGKDLILVPCLNASDYWVKASKAILNT